jgi:hypothetical protein
MAASRYVKVSGLGWLGGNFMLISSPRMIGCRCSRLLRVIDAEFWCLVDLFAGGDRRVLLSFARFER